MTVCVVIAAILGGLLQLAAVTADPRPVAGWFLDEYAPATETVVEVAKAVAREWMGVGPEVAANVRHGLATNSCCPLAPAKDLPAWEAVFEGVTLRGGTSRGVPVTNTRIASIKLLLDAQTGRLRKAMALADPGPEHLVNEAAFGRYLSREKVVAAPTVMPKVRLLEAIRRLAAESHVPTGLRDARQIVAAYALLA